MLLRSPGGCRSRTGKTLTLVALLLPPLCGLVGLVIDGGVMLTARRQAQNAADGAARAAATARAAGASDADALSAAEVYVRSYNQLPGAAVVLNSPPLAGSYAGQPGYVEVVVTTRTDAWFIPVVGGDPHPTVAARAVAGTEATAPREVLCALDPNAVPGVTVDGTTLQVNGRVWVNSQGAGYDESGGWTDLGSPPSAVRCLNGGSVRTDRLRVVGGTDAAAAYTNAAGLPSLKARQLPRTDPYLNLPTPTTANGVTLVYPGANGTTFTAPQNVSVTLVSGETVTFGPGIYGSIEVTGTGGVTFAPGIYVLKGGSSSGRALNVSVTGTVSGAGVMFYNTGSTYDPVAGGPDQTDGNVLGTDAGTFGDVTLNAGALDLTPVSAPSSPFAGFLLYQRRWNTKPITVYRNSSDGAIVGTIYARWAKLALVNPGAFSTQCVVGSFAASGSTAGASVTISPPPTVGKAGLVFLVE